MSTELLPGLVSVTFRQLAVDEVVDLAAKAGLVAIEWGGDVHVPAGDLAAAQRARELSEKRGLRIVSYGSYYRAGSTDPGEFSTIVRTALTLGAPSIRVWAGDVGSADITDEQRAKVVTALRRAVEEASAQDMDVALEFHQGTLTDRVGPTMKLLDEIDAGERLWSYWQPGRGTPPALAVEQVRALRSRLSTVHVFSWAPSGEREPLAEQEEMWRGVLAKLTTEEPETWIGSPPPGASTPPKPPETVYALIEFVPDDDPKAFETDAKTLLEWLGRLE